MAIGICCFLIHSYGILKLIDVLKPHILQGNVFAFVIREIALANTCRSMQVCSGYSWKKYTDSGRKKRKRSWREKRKSTKIFSQKKHLFGNLKHAETCSFTTDSKTATANLKPCLPFFKDLSFNLIRAEAVRSGIPCSFWKVTGKTPHNQKIFMISIDFQFSWFICSLSEHSMLVCSKLYVEFALIRCLCNRH